MNYDTRRQLTDIPPRSVSRDLQTYGVPTFGKRILPLTRSRPAVSYSHTGVILTFNVCIALASIAFDCYRHRRMRREN